MRPLERKNGDPVSTASRRLYYRILVDAAGIEPATPAV